MFALRFFLLAAAITLTPSLAHAYTWTFCFKHNVTTVDSGFGEDIQTVNSAAWVSRGTKVRLFKGGVWIDLPSTSVTTGCVNYTSATADAVILELTAQHTLANNQVVRIKNDFAGTKATKVWTFTATLPPSSTTLDFFTPYGAESNLAAIVPSIVNRMTALTGNLPAAAGKALDVYNQNCSVLGACDGSGYSPGNDAVFIAANYNHSERKFLVGHEIGHWLEEGWASNFNGGGGGYALNEGVGDPCEFTGLGDHGLRSRELDFPAYEEGIAHFIAAMSWNDPLQNSGVFKYYKNSPPHNFETFQLDSPGLYAFNWESQCDDGKLAGTSVEGDWLRHFWNYLNDPTGIGAQPTVADLAEHIRAMHVAGGMNSGNTYPKLTAALAAGYPAFLNHWTTRATIHGPIDP